MSPLNCLNPEAATDRFELECGAIGNALRTPAIDVMAAHESVRRFRPDLVEDDALNAILLAARSAPTSSNLQAYSIVVVRDQDRRSRLSELVGSQAAVVEAPVFLIFCADVARLRYVAERQGRPFDAETLDMFLLASLDAGLAMENALIAAESLGLGTVPIGSVRNDPVDFAAELNLPSGVYAVVGLCIGWEAADSRRGTKPRLPRGEVVYFEQYSELDREHHITGYDQTMIQRRTYDGRRVSIAGEPETEVEYGWAEHTSRRTSKPQDAGISSPLREGFKAALEERGFTIQ